MSKSQVLCIAALCFLALVAAQSPKQEESSLPEFPLIRRRILDPQPVTPIPTGNNQPQQPGSGNSGNQGTATTTQTQPGSTNQSGKVLAFGVVLFVLAAALLY